MPFLYHLTVTFSKSIESASVIVAKQFRSSVVIFELSVEFIWVDGLVGATVTNTTDGSSGVITDNNATYVIVAALTGGSDNSWDDSANDAYTITGLLYAYGTKIIKKK